MNAEGEVVAILSGQCLLLKADVAYDPGMVLTVYGQVVDERLSEFCRVPSLIYPKGEIRVLARQENDVYLAERFREIRTRTKRVKQPGLADMQSYFARVLGGAVTEVSEQVEGSWSVAIDPADSFGIKLEMKVKVGDRVGR